ncbi:MAG: hypothetical protein Q4E13_04280 [Clostridia bacterium]|nr:hypothetical protein [Clostridia bacterium]
MTNRLQAPRGEWKGRVIEFGPRAAFEILPRNEMCRPNVLRDFRRAFFRTEQEGIFDKTVSVAFSGGFFCQNFGKHA